MWLITIETHAQTTLQVATKSVEKTFTDAKKLTIEAEKAEIEILTWDKPEIKVVLDLIAKHPDRKTASQDLEVMKYVATKLSKEVFLRNYIMLQDEKQKPASNMKAKYVIRIPESFSISIQNTFGKVSMKGKVKDLLIKSDFCIIDLNEVEGNIRLITNYGEINTKHFSGGLNIESERSDITMNQLGGNILVNNHYGKLIINSVKYLTKLTINAQKADVLLDGISLKNYQFEIFSNYGKLDLPSEFSYLINEKNKKTAILNGQSNSKISISNSFGSITLKN